MEPSMVSGLTIHTIFYQNDLLDMVNLPPGINEDEIQEIRDYLAKELSILGFSGLGKKLLKRIPRSEAHNLGDSDDELNLAECKSFRFGSSSYDDYMRHVEVILLI
jgi:hypothetical protein